MIYTHIVVTKLTPAIKRFLAMALKGDADRYLGGFAIFDITAADEDTFTSLVGTEKLWLEFKRKEIG